MAAFVSMLRTTRDNAREQGRVFAGFVRLEARRWRRYATARARYATATTRQLLTPTAFERELLVRVDGTLRALDGKVTDRLATLAPKAPRAAKRLAAKRKSPPSRPSGTNLLAGGRKQAS